MEGKNVSAELRAKMDLLGRRAVAASRAMGAASPGEKALALRRLAALLRGESDAVFAANAKDIDVARRAGMDAPRLDRLTLTPAIMEEMARACEQVADMPDPIGAMDRQWQRPNGLLVGRMRVPLGVVAMIYESRPNVTIDAAILCLKAGNAVILRGGSEAFASNMVLAALLARALKEAGLPADAAQVVDCTDRAVVSMLCAMDNFIDVLIPRGGENLVRRVCAEATMPVLKHFMGVCHMYIDESADADMAVALARNGKVQRPGVCNALECLLVHRAIAETVLPALGRALGEDGVTFRACPRSLPLLGEKAEPQTSEDLGREFHALVLAVCVVDSLDEALEHIARYGSHHTEVICTRNHANAMRFLREADASMVAVNASTRFNDGGQLGLGAEIGISTSKLHAYGPMGVRELTTTKFVVFGSGQVRR